MIAQKQIKTSDRGWCVVSRDSSGEIARAWSWLPGTAGIRAVEGREAQSLALASKTQGHTLREVPEQVWVWPTGFDLQVHLRFPGQEGRETLEGGLASAFQGGFDTVVTMPNTEPFLDNAAVLQSAIKEARARQAAAGYPVSALFTAAATQGMRGDVPAAILELVRAGAVAITDDGWGVKSSEAMLAVLKACASAGVAFLQHAEMPGHKGHASPSPFQAQAQIPAYPRTAESEMVRRDLELLEQAPGARYHVLHVSTRETLAEVRRGKEAGLAVTAEVSPHHLFFSNRDITGAQPSLTTAFKMNPPLFDPEDRLALVAALESGLIDCVSTDHAPHSAEAKAAAWAEAPFGTRGLETALSTLVTLVVRGELSEARARAAFSQGGRRVLGDSAPAAQGLLFIDPRSTREITTTHLPGISRNSCFLGSKLNGEIILRADPGALYGQV